MAFVPTAPNIIAEKSSVGDSTPGLLRLPVELRLQIYELLFYDDWHPMHISPRTNQALTPPRILNLPVMQVCQKLRNESLPLFYSKTSWILTKHDLTRRKHYIEAMDADVIEHLGGFNISTMSLRRLGHGFRSEVEWYEKIYFTCKRHLSKVSAVLIPILCTPELSEHEKRVEIVQRFAQDIEDDRSKIKEKLLQMLETLQAL